MATDFKQSETMKNLMRAFAGESQARNRYTFAAGQAHQQGLYVIEKIFRFTADQEKEHAEIFYNQLKELAGETIEIDGTYPVDLSPNMTELLKMAQHNEYEEHDDVYQHFGDKAQEEGFGKAAVKFHKIAEIEKIHGDRFGQIAELMEKNELFQTETEEIYMCLNCGHIYSGTSVPAQCPVCLHGKGYFIPAGLAPYLAECCMN